jgi:hypothetical protein
MAEELQENQPQRNRLKDAKSVTDIAKAILEYGIRDTLNGANALADGLVRSGVNLADFVSSPVRYLGNKGLEASGQDFRLNSIAETPIPFTEKTVGERFQRPALATSREGLLGMMGEYGAGGRGFTAGAQGIIGMLGRIPAAEKGLGRNVFETISKVPVADDLAIGGMAGVGAGIANPTGNNNFAELVGGLSAPLSMAGVGAASRRLSSVTARNNDPDLFNNFLLESGKTPDEFIDDVINLGPEGIPADIAPFFAKGLKTLTEEATTLNPTLYSNQRADLIKKAQETIDFVINRSQGSAQRIDKSLNADGSEAKGSKYLDEFIDNFLNTRGKESNEAYNNLRISKNNKVNYLLNNTDPKTATLSTVEDLDYVLNNLSSPTTNATLQNRSGIPVEILNFIRTRGTASRKAFSTAIQGIKNSANQGNREITLFDVINRTKKNISDQINYAQAEGSSSVDLKILENDFVGLADDFIPEYSSARNLISEREDVLSLISAGRSFNKKTEGEFSTEADAFQKFTNSLSEDQTELFRMGVRENIRKTASNVKTRAGSPQYVGRTLRDNYFGSDADIERTRTAFGNDESFNQFKNQVDREVKYEETTDILRNTNTEAKLGGLLKNESDWFRSIEPFLIPNTLSRVNRVIQLTKKMFSYLRDIDAQKNMPALLDEAKELSSILGYNSREETESMINLIFNRNSDAFAAKVSKGLSNNLLKRSNTNLYSFTNSLIPNTLSEQKYSPSQTRELNRYHNLSPEEKQKQWLLLSQPFKDAYKEWSENDQQ